MWFNIYYDDGEDLDLFIFGELLFVWFLVIFYENESIVVVSLLIRYMDKGRVIF